MLLLFLLFGYLLIAEEDFRVEICCDEKFKTIFKIIYWEAINFFVFIAVNLRNHFVISY